MSLNRNIEASKMSTFDTKSQSDRGKTCLDYFGNTHPHGAYFKPPYSVCSECLCNNGLTTKCISMQCPKPACEGYKRMPGKCCDYVCPDYQATDATTLAILITLSIALLLIIIAIVVVWRKMRRKKLYGNRLDSVSTSSNQDPDIDTMIQQNSIPNNKRHHLIYKTPKNTHLKSTPTNDNSSSSYLVKKHFSKHFIPTNNKLNANSTKQNNLNLNKTTNYSKVSSSEIEESSSASSSLKSTSSILKSASSSIKSTSIDNTSELNSTPLLQKNKDSLVTASCSCMKTAGKKRCDLCDGKTYDTTSCL